MQVQRPNRTTKGQNHHHLKTWFITVLIFMSKCSKTHLRAYLIPTKFPEVIPRTSAKRGGEGSCKFSLKIPWLCLRKVEDMEIVRWGCRACLINPWFVIVDRQTLLHICCAWRVFYCWMCECAVDTILQQMIIIWCIVLTKNGLLFGHMCVRWWLGWGWIGLGCKCWVGLGFIKWTRHPCPCLT